jgi:hypothetical protein
MTQSRQHEKKIENINILKSPIGFNLVCFVEKITSYHSQWI